MKVGKFIRLCLSSMKQVLSRQRPQLCIWFHKIRNILLRRYPVDSKDYWTLYRGVPKNHPEYHLATKGIVLPRRLVFGHKDIERHNHGDTKTSKLTSWTFQKDVAINHAGIDGVVLEITIPKKDTMHSFDIWFENERLVRTCVIDAKVEFITKQHFEGKMNQNVLKGITLACSLMNYFQ